MVNVDHAVLWVHLHRLWEEVHELDQRLLRSGSCWVVHEDDTLSVLLDRSIALFIFQISADIPELNVDLAEVRNWCRGFALKVDDHSEQVQINFTDSVCHCFDSETYLTPIVGLYVVEGPSCKSLRMLVMVLFPAFCGPTTRIFILVILTFFVNN